MSLTYNPGASIIPNTTWDITFLSDRDVSAQVPINFVPHPGITLTSACFSNHVYDNTPAGNCVSNLLASQLQRYVIDLYWDVANRRFSLCPVELPTSNVSTPSTTGTGGQITNTTFQSTLGSTLTARQNGGSLGGSTITSYTAAIPQATARSGFAVVNTDNGRTLYQIDQYRCSNSLALDSILGIFNDYMIDTSDTTQAKMSILIINLHVATAVSAPSVPHSMVRASELPTAEQSVRTFFNDLDSILYKPGALLSDRQSLNASWFRHAVLDEEPFTSYFTLYKTPNGDLATMDGWPGEGFIQQVRGKRMIVGFGTIDDNFQYYNTSADGDRIFPSGYLISETNVSFNENGTLSRGCFYDGNSFNINQLNNSWAVASINVTNPANLGDMADNLTVCGISQILNATVDNQTADAFPDPYQDFGDNAVFSWAYGQPQNDSNANPDSASKFRCALMVSNDAFRGHWRVEYCTQKYRVACRIANKPYQWSISAYKVDFTYASAACTGNTSFDVPRTGLENNYLWHHIIRDSIDDASLLDGVWINFNALRVENCWITTGVNGSCPYYQNSNMIYSRQILIPTLAAFIVLILTALTILVKCSNNARDSRRVRRGNAGWDYEGVPS